MGLTAWEQAFDAASNEETEDFPELQVEEEVSVPLHGLLSLGYLRDNLQVGSHTIEIRTLRIGEELAASLLIDKYKDTTDAGRAYATAVVAACIQSVDGKPLYTPLGPSDLTLEQKFEWITKNWYWATIKEVWQAYNNLEEKATTAAEELKKKLELSHVGLEGLIMVLDRQGLLKGDLNRIQAEALVWVINKDVEDQNSLERTRLENLALASNPVTNPKLIEALLGEAEEEMEQYENMEWLTPETPEEVEKALDLFSILPIGDED